MDIVLVLVLIAIMVAAAYMLNRVTAKKAGKIEKFFRFDTLLGVRLIRVFYPAAAFFITITGLFCLFYAPQAAKVFGHDALRKLLLWGFVILIAGNLALRILCEALVALFRINDNIELNCKRELKRTSDKAEE